MKSMTWRVTLLLAALALLAGCSASVPIRPYMFIQNDEPNAPHLTPETDDDPVG